MKKHNVLLKTASYEDSLLESLKDPTEAAHYLQAAFEMYQEDGETAAFLLALRNVAKARGGLSLLSKKTHLNRQNLYRVLSSEGNPRLDTLGVIMKELGFTFSIRPTSTYQAAKFD